MTNSNSFANNSFDAIDSEFGINNNSTTTTEVKTMSNETVSQTATDALTMLATASQPTIQEPTEMLAKEEVTPGWTVVSQEELDALYKINSLEHREVKTSTYAWKIFNQRTFVQKSSFNDKVWSSVGKNQATVADLESLSAKHFFTNNEVANISVVDGIFSGTHSTKLMTVKVAVDFNKGKIAYVAKHTYANKFVEPKVKDLRKFAVINFISNTKSSSAVSGLYSAVDTVRLFWAMVQNCYTVSQFDFLVAGMTSKLYVDASEQSQRLSNSERGTNKPVYGNREFAPADLDLLSREQIIEAHKISVIPCVVGVTNYSDNGRVVFMKSNSEGKFNGTEFQTAYSFFSQFEEPIIIDKQAKKWLCYGDGARASFVDYVETLVTANPVDKASKLLNRMASHSYKQAFDQSVSYGNEGVIGNYVKSNLQIALKNSVCWVEGIETPVFFSFGDFALNAGTIETNALQSVRFSYSVPKSLTKEVSIKEFRADFLLGEDGEPLSNSELAIKIQETVLAQLIKLGNVVAGNSGVKVAGATVLLNDRHFAIHTDNSYVVKASDVTVRLSGTTFAGSASTVSVSIKGYARMENKCSPKMRGNLKKGTCFPTDTVIKQASAPGTAVDWTVLLSPETVKGSSGMAELLANHDEFIDREVVWNKGKLLVDGAAIDVEKAIEGLCDTYTIERKFSADVFEHKSFKPVLAQIDASSNCSYVTEGNVVVVTETVKGFFSYTNFSVEVSTADENAGYSSLGTNEQHIAALFNDRISNNLMLSSQVNLGKAKYLATDESQADVIDINDREAVSELASMVGSGTKHSMEKLAIAHPSGVVIQGGGFSQFLPFGILLHFGNWDGIFPGSTASGRSTYGEDMGIEEQELKTSNICREVFDFINSINQDWVIELSDSSTVRELIASLNGLRGWVKAVQERSASKLMKVNAIAKGKNKRKAKQFNYHLKVVGNTMLGFENELPVIEIHPDNPSGYRDGSKVLLARCPLPLYTACVVRHNSSLDSTVVAVNPLIWSASNAGDNDGDLAYLLNLFVACGGEVSDEDCVKYNERFSGLATHWEVFGVDDKGRKPMSPLFDNLGGKSFQDRLSGFSAMGAVISNEHFKSVPLVQKHYAIGVGEFHKVATALTERVGNGVHSFDGISRDAVVAIHKAWFDYEEFGLGGWTKHNSDVLLELKKQITSEVFTPGCLSPRSRRGKTPTTSINILAIQASALVELGSRVMKDEAGATDEAIIAQALKRLAKKEIVNGEYELWVAIRAILEQNPNAFDGYRFGEHLRVLGQVRLNCLI